MRENSLKLSDLYFNYQQQNYKQQITLEIPYITYSPHKSKLETLINPYY